MFPGIAEQVVPTLHSMQQEPAWPAIVAGHQPEDWPDSAPLPDYHQDLVYLSSEKALSVESAQAIHSFYSFIWVRPKQQHTRYVSYMMHGMSLQTSKVLGHLTLLPQCFIKSAGMGVTLVIQTCR